MNLRGAPVGSMARAGASVFSLSPFAAEGLSGANKGLGQTEQAWYARGKAAAVKYDDLWERTKRIADKAYREQLADQFHYNPDDRSGGLFMKNLVAYHVAKADSFTPINYSAFNEDIVRSTIEQLEDVNRDFERQVASGEETLGVLSVPEATESTGKITKENGLPKWVIPAAVIGALTALIAFVSSGE